jgi:hypothetical protein
MRDITSRAEAVMTDRPTGAERLRVAIAWLFVAVPAVWGVAQVIAKSAALFR